MKNPAELSNPIGRLQMFLLVFPYSSNDAVGDHADAVELELGFASQSGAMLVSDGGDGGADSPSNASTTRHMAVLQVTKGALCSPLVRNAFQPGSIILWSSASCASCVTSLAGLVGLVSYNEPTFVCGYR